MEINNKLESFEMINKLGLNKLPEKVFKKGETKEVLKFIKEYPAKYYAIRDKSKSRGVFKLKVEEKDILKEIKDYDLFSINVSSFNYAANQLLAGEMEFLSNNDVYACVSTEKGLSARDAASNPTFNIKSNIFEENCIPYFDELYEYVSLNELYDVIVEFALFDIPVGINNEKIIIYELRTNY